LREGWDLLRGLLTGAEVASRVADHRVERMFLRQPETCTQGPRAWSKYLQSRGSSRPSHYWWDIEVEVEWHCAIVVSGEAVGWRSFSVQHDEPSHPGEGVLAGCRRVRGGAWRESDVAQSLRCGRLTGVEMKGSGFEMEVRGRKCGRGRSGPGEVPLLC
jgi:hypothetical protein